MVQTDVIKIAFIAHDSLRENQYDTHTHLRLSIHIMLYKPFWVEDSIFSLFFLENTFTFLLSPLTLQTAHKNSTWRNLSRRLDFDSIQHSLGRFYFWWNFWSFWNFSKILESFLLDDNWGWFLSGNWRLFIFEIYYQIVKNNLYDHLFWKYNLSEISDSFRSTTFRYANIIQNFQTSYTFSTDHHKGYTIWYIWLKISSNFRQKSSRSYQRFLEKKFKIFAFSHSGQTLFLHSHLILL